MKWDIELHDTKLINRSNKSNNSQTAMYCRAHKVPKVRRQYTTLLYILLLTWLQSTARSVECRWFNCSACSTVWNRLSKCNLGVCRVLSAFPAQLKVLKTNNHLSFNCIMIGDVLLKLNLLWIITTGILSLIIAVVNARNGFHFQVKLLAIEMTILLWRTKNTQERKRYSDPDSRVRGFDRIYSE